nr:PREDICTED: protein yellow-like [Bemisia tabaci]
MQPILLTLLVVATLWQGCSLGTPRNELVEVFSWKTLDFAYPSEQSRQQAIAAGDFIPGNSVPMGVEVWQDKVFISVPRLGKGVPSSLNYVKMNDMYKAPKLIPYPNWASQNMKSKEPGLKIVSPFRMSVDACDRLWMVDLGILDIKTSFTKLFQPRILVFDLKTDQLVLEREIEAKLLPCRTWIANIIVDVERDNCQDAWAYIPDLWGKVLIVYSMQKNDAYQVNHQYFNSDPLAGNYFIGGFNFRWDDGIFGVALSPRSAETGEKTLFFHALSAYTEYAVSTRVLKNATLAADFYGYKLLGSRGGEFNQAGAQSMDPQTGVLFYTLPHKNAIGCWNACDKSQEYSPRTAVQVVQNNVTLLYPSDLKVDRASRVWVVSNKLPVFNNDALNNNEVNFRILYGEANKVIEDTPCDPNFVAPPVFDKGPQHQHQHQHHQRRRAHQRRAPQPATSAIKTVPRLWP